KTTDRNKTFSRYFRYNANIPPRSTTSRKTTRPMRSALGCDLDSAVGQPPLSSGLRSSCGLFLYLPTPHRDYSISLLRNKRIMGNYDEGQSIIVVQASQQLDNLRRILGVQIPSRLVAPYYRGL